MTPSRSKTHSGVQRANRRSNQFMPPATPLGLCGHSNVYQESVLLPWRDLAADFMRAVNRDGQATARHRVTPRRTSKDAKG
jgi:hypothetical protein